MSETLPRSALPRQSVPSTTGYTRVPNIVRTLGLSPRQEQLVNRLLECRRDGPSPWPSVKTLATRMNDCSVRTVQRAIKALEDRGLLTVEYRYRVDGSQQSSVYHLAAVLLPPSGNHDGTGMSPTRHQGVTRLVGKEEHPGKNTKRTGQSGYKLPPADRSAYFTGQYGHLVKR